MISNGDDSIGKYIGETFLFSTYLAEDVRTPAVTFALPSFVTSFLGEEYKNARVGLINASLELWIALLMVLLICFIFNAILAILSYHFIVLPRKQQQLDQSKKDGRSNNNIGSHFIFGFGFIMPLTIVYPYYCIPYFGVKSKLLKFFFGVQMITTFFRCSEAMFGYLPKHVDDSLFNTMVYYSVPVETKFDANGPLKSTWSLVGHYIKKFVMFVILLGGYSSILSPYNYMPFAVGDGIGLFDLGQLANNAVLALQFQLYLTTFGYAVFAFTSLCGLQQHPMMLNPIFESTSPSDFWGRRWNLVVHALLKRGVYKPVRSKYSRFAASMASFVASGVFHEWLLSVLYLLDDSSDPNPQHPKYGLNTAFFVWNAIIIGLEHMIGGAKIFQLLKNNLPPILLSLLVTVTSLPVAHWFTSGYIENGLFQDGQIGFPMVVLQH